MSSVDSTTDAMPERPGNTDAGQDPSFSVEGSDLQGKFHYEQELKRRLSLAQLTAYGLNYMAPLGPGLIVGLLIVQSGGTAALPYALAGVAMIFTAASYVVLVPNFPLAGSIYNYVARGWNPYLGFLAGWAMITYYLFVPAVVTISGAYYAMAMFPFLPFWGIIGGIAILTGVLNFFGVELMAKVGLWLLLIGEVVLAVALTVWSWAAGHGIGYGTVLTGEVFKFTSLSTLASATSLAVFNYLGFDAISTLAEEAKHPKRDVPRAIYLACIIGGCTMVMVGYFAALIVPDWSQLASDPNFLGATLYHVSMRAGGTWLASFVTAGWLLMVAVFNVVSSAAAVRLMYGMGRDNIIPKPIFGAVNKRFGTPHWNILILVLLTIGIAATSNISTLTLLINFGAMTGFLTLNVVVIVMYIVRKNGVELKITRARPILFYLRFLVVPALGVIVIGFTFLNLGSETLIYGGAWMALGVLYLAVRTKGFRELPPVLEV